jgi:hypothetical protein
MNKLLDDAEFRKKHPREAELVGVLEPILDDIVALERDVEARWKATTKLLGEEREFAVQQLTKAKEAIDATSAKIDAKTEEAEAKALAAVDALRQQDISELRLKNVEVFDFAQRSFDDLVGRVDEAINASNEAVNAAINASNEAVNAASETARETMEPAIKDLRADFETAILSVKSVLDENLRTISRAARDFEERMKTDQQNAANTIIAAAANYGS